MHILQVLENGKHVLCESPITMTAKETKKLLELAQKKCLILMEAIKTAYSTAYNRLLLLLKSGKIGKVVSVETISKVIEKYNNGPIKSINITIKKRRQTALFLILDYYLPISMSLLVSLFMVLAKASTMVVAIR